MPQTKLKDYKFIVRFDREAVDDVEIAQDNQKKQRGPFKGNKNTRIPNLLKLQWRYELDAVKELSTKFLFVAIKYNGTAHGYSIKAAILWQGETRKDASQSLVSTLQEKLYDDGRKTMAGMFKVVAK